jgi:hypothetical protein
MMNKLSELTNAEYDRQRDSRFVNQQDTLGELTRMASERATADKLAKLAERATAE